MKRLQDWGNQRSKNPQNAEALIANKWRTIEKVLNGKRYGVKNDTRPVALT